MKTSVSNLFAVLVCSLMVFVSSSVLGVEAESLPDDGKEVKRDSMTEEEKYLSYRTPRAGEKYTGEVFGSEVVVQKRDRAFLLALNIGAMSINLEEISPNPLPIVGLFYRHHLSNNKRRLQGLFAGVLNNFSYEDETWNGLGINFLGTFRNFYNISADPEAFNGADFDGSEVVWGYVRAGLGIGWRAPLKPGHVDNDFLIGVYVEPGLWSFDDDDDTSPAYVVPENTLETRFRLKVRADAFERNILELRHFGWAAGAEVVIGRRSDWEDHDFGGRSRGDDTESYTIFTAYASAAFGLPHLSEHHRFITTVHYGRGSRDDLDRFSAMSLGGGPSSDQAGALGSPTLFGAAAGELLTSEYFLFTFEYRYQLAFFMYLHFRLQGGYAWARNIDTSTNVIDFDYQKLGALSLALSSGFVWSSTIYLEISNNWELREGDEKGRTTILFSWTKTF